MLCCSEQCEMKYQCGRYWGNPQPEYRKYDNVESLATHGWGSISSQGCEDHYDCGPLGDYKMFEPFHKDDAFDPYRCPNCEKYIENVQINEKYLGMSTH